MTLTNTHPLEPLAKALEQAFEAIDNPSLRDALSQHPDYAGLTLHEEGSTFIIKLNLEDINPDEVHLAYEESLLTIRCGRAQAQAEGSTSATLETFANEQDEANPNPDKLERYLPFEYQLTLPTGIDPNAVTADFVEDMLQLELAKLIRPRH